MIWDIAEQKSTIEGLDAEGRPDPAYAQALGLLRAPFGRRALAFAVDVGIWAVLALPLLIGAVPLVAKLATGAISPYGFLNHPDFLLAAVTAGVSTLLGVVYLVVQLILHGVKGVTIGKAATGIRSVNVRTLERPRVGAVFVRFVLLIASGIIPLLGPAFLLVSPTFDPEGRGRGLHDKATGVWLVDVRRGLNPYDQKRMRVARKVVKAEPTRGRSALPSLATPADPDAQPEYRPAGRVSAGVIGMARPHDARDRPAIGLATAAPAATPLEVQPGTPVLGGYREIVQGQEPTDAAALPTARDTESAPAGALGSDPVPNPVPASVPEPPLAHEPEPERAREPERAPEPARAAVFGLVFDSGERIAIDGAVLLGRNPDAADHAGARAVALADDSRSLSKTHLLVRSVADGVEITDCGSTNGSGLIRAGTEYAVVAGTPILTTEGDSVRLGDRVAAVVRL